MAVKISVPKIPRWQTAAIWKIEKFGYFVKHNGSV